MKFFILLLTFLIFIQSALAQTTPRSISFEDQSVLLNGRRVQLQGPGGFGGLSVLGSSNRINVTNGLSASISPGAFLRAPGVYIQPQVIEVCNQIETAVATAQNPRQMLEGIISAWRINLEGVPRQKYLDVFEYFQRPQDLFRGDNAREFESNTKRAYCQTTIARAVSTSIQALVRPGGSGVDPRGEADRESASNQMIEDQLKRCEENPISSIDCPPVTINPLNLNISNDILNITNIVNPTGTTERSAVSLFSGQPTNQIGFDNSIERRIANLTGFESFMSPAEKLCNCNARNYKVQGVPQERINTERNKISSLVRDRLYKKFLNDYAQNREDISFFMNHRGNVLRGQDSDALSCKKLKDFQDRANQRCAQNGVSEEVRKQREAELFGKMRVDNPNAPISENWRNLENAISTIKFPSGTTDLPDNISSEGFNRVAFDQVRHGFSEDNRSRAFNRLLTNLIKDPDFKKWHEASPNRNPSVLLMDYMENVRMSNDPARLDAIAKMAEDDEAIDIAEFKADIVGKFVNLMQDVTAYAPEFRISLSSPEIFKEVMAKAAKPGFKDFSSVITNDPKANPQDKSSLIYENHMKWKCGQIMDSFANAICADNDKLVDNVDSDDLRTLLQQNPMSDIDPDYSTYVTCKNKLSLQTISLDIDVPYSSLLSRVVEREKDFFAKIKDLVVSKDKTVLSYISGMAREASGTSVEIENKAALDSNNISMGGLPSSSGSNRGGRASLWDHVDSDGSIRSERVYSENKLIARSETLTPNKDKSHTESVSRTDSEKTTLDQVADTMNAKEIKVATPEVPYAGTYSARSGTEKVSQEKSELRQSLGSDGNKPEVQQQISRIDDEMAEELNRLREEAAQNRQKLADLTSQAQESKIRMLQDQLKRLQEERRTVVEASPVPAVNPDTRSDYIIAPQRTASQNREIASEGTPEPESTKTVAGQKPTSSTQDQAAVSGNATTLRGQSRGDAPSQGESSSGGVAPLVVTSTAVRSESSVDMNLEMIKFLDAANPDLSTLTQIKDQGLLYRYKVMMNGVEREQEVLILFSGLNENARQAIERKISQRRSENPRLAQVEDSIAEVQRKVSYESLKYIIGQQLSR